MLKFLLEQGAKSAKICTAAAAMKVGAPLDGGHFVAQREMQYDGINAVIAPRLKDNDDIAIGDLYTKVPVFKGDRLATDQITTTGLTAGDPVTVANDKFAKETVASGATPVGGYVYVGEWTLGNPYGVAMHIVERVLP